MKRAVVPQWLKWVLGLSAAVCVIVAVAIIARRNPGDQILPPASTTGEAQSNSEGQSVTARDQAPHHSALVPSLAPRVALERAIAADVRGLVAAHNLAGPMQRVSCTQLPLRNGNSLAFRCTALAASFSYPFAGVVDLSTRELTWCKDDNVTGDSGLEVPLSPACTR